MKYFLIFIIALLVPASSFAGGVIFQDQMLTFPVVSILVSPDPSYDEYVQVYNYFFTIVLANGLVAAALHQLIRIFK